MNKRHALFLILATLMTCTFVWVRLKIVSVGYEIQDLEKQERMLREECNALTLKINEAKSPHRLEHLARTKFNMHPAQSNQVVVFK